MTSARTLLASANLRAKKHLGQNFLNSPKTGRDLVSRSEIDEAETIVEIGAGLGAMTLPLAEAACRVIAVERDVHLLPVLQKEIRSHRRSNVHLIGADILKLDIARIARKFETRLTVAGNLPYNISSQVLVQLVEARAFVDRAVLMFQKELAARILSPPGRKTYGRLTVMVRYCADVRKVCDLKADAFFPRPKIDSTVLEIRFREPRPEAADDERLLFRLIAAAFGQRRKMLRNALAGGRLAIDSQILAEGLNAAGISGGRRAETLSVAEFVRLSNAVTGRLNPEGVAPRR
jgi:16S rRNA (adenine1518-N6/adenine1519-N6)-dimethyltransferase